MNPTAPFEGKVAVITGVGRAGQLGETVALRFALLGATVVLLDRSSSVHERVNDLQGDGARVIGAECDLTDLDSASRAVAEVRAFAGNAVHALVCLAGGFAMTGPVAETAPSEWQRQLAINLTTAFVTTRAFLPLLREGAGSIVYFASAAALPGASIGKMAAYAASKSGVVALMRAVALEERPNGVRANALAPTSIRTKDNIESMGSAVAYVEREDVAEWVTFLCAPPGAAANGQVIKLGSVA